MGADNEIIMKTPKCVKIDARSQLVMLKTQKTSGMALEVDLNYKSNNVILDGTYKKPFPDSDDDEPKEGKKPEPPKEMSLWEKVAIGVAVVAAVAIPIAIGTEAAVNGVVGAMKVMKLEVVLQILL